MDFYYFRSVNASIYYEDNDIERKRLEANRRGIDGRQGLDEMRKEKLERKSEPISFLLTVLSMINSRLTIDHSGYPWECDIISVGLAQQAEIIKVFQHGSIASKYSPHLFN